MSSKKATSGRSGHSPSAGSRGRVHWIVILGVVLVVGLAALSFWPESEAPTSGRHATADQTALGDDHDAAQDRATPVQLYTCGMHPQVLSEEPGHCPICGMRLTPVDVTSDEAPSAKETNAPAESGERKVKYWRAPMDPTYISDRPGKSPMGMDLVPVYEDEIDASGPTVRISPVVVQNMGVRTALVERAPLSRVIRTVGRIEYDETLVRDVTIKFEGWIEELYADYTGQYVEKGSALFTVYSPQIYSTQEEYLLALKNRDSIRNGVLPQAQREMRQLIDSARLRLQLFDISDEQIDDLGARGQPSKTMTILSPHTGVIVEKTARDGLHISSGTKLYTIADLSRVWVHVDIFENEVPFVKLGQEAVMELSYLPGQVFHGKVIYVYPFVDTKTRTVKVRLEFANPHLELKPGMFADVRINTDLGRSGTVAPSPAVIDTGRRQVAFVALGEGRFEPRELTTGVDLGNDRIEILSGLRPGEEVVVSGQFLLDSESKLREAVLKMIEQKREHARAPASTDGKTDGRAAREHALASAVEKQPADVPPASLPELAEPVEVVLDAYLELQALLARDEFQGLHAAATALATPLANLQIEAAALEGLAAERAIELSANAQSVVAAMRGASADAVRAQFTELSKHVIAIVNLVGAGRLERPLHAFYCPMAGAAWLQEADEPANPYYGFSMLRCGEQMELAGTDGEQR